MRRNLSILQMLFGLMAVVMLWGLALVSLSLGLAVQDQRDLPGEAGAVLLGASANLALVGLLLLPTVWYGLQGWQGQPMTPAAAETPPSGPLRRWLPHLLFFVALPLVLAAGVQFGAAPAFAAWLPLFNILAVCIPVYWLSHLALNGLPGRSAQRDWGLLGSGLLLAPGLILLVEMLLLGAALAAFIFAAVANPALGEEIQSLALRLQFAASSPAQLNRLLQPYLSQPWVLLSLFGFVALLAPLLEEMLKPLGLWLLAGLQPSPAQGFAAGVLGGAGFAIFESLFMNLNFGAESWGGTALARIGTAAMHIFASGLTGWGLACAWSGGQYGRLGLSFSAAVLLHALWNGLAIGAALLGLQGEAGVSLATALSFGIGLLAAVSVVGLGWLNRSLRTDSSPVVIANERSK